MNEGVFGFVVLLFMIIFISLLLTYCHHIVTSANYRVIFAKFSLDLSKQPDRQTQEEWLSHS